MPPFNLLLGAPIARYLVASLTVAALLGGAYLAIDYRAVTRCERDHELVRLKAEEVANQKYLAEVGRGNAISTELIKTQRRLDATKREYLAYASGITGNCPADLGLFLAAESAGPMPASPSTPTSPAATLAASFVAQNIAENRARFEANFAQCSALIRFYTRQEEVVK